MMVTPCVCRFIEADAAHIPSKGTHAFSATEGDVATDAEYAFYQFVGF